MRQGAALMRKPRRVALPRKSCKEFFQTINRLRLVLDTNVVVSGLIFSESLPGQVLSLAQASCTILQSADTLDELANVLARPKFDRWVSQEARANAFVALGLLCELVTELPKLDICRDPIDNQYLELAVGGEATYIVTGDDDLLAIERIGEANIVTPKQFLDWNSNK